MHLMRFMLQIVPITSLAVMSTLIGVTVSPPALASELAFLLVFIDLLLFVALITFKRVSGWNVALLLGFAVMVGILLRGFAPSELTRSWGSIVLTIGILVSAAAVGRKLRGRTKWVGIGVGFASWAYLVGWGLIALLRLKSLPQTLWAGVGLMIFGGLSALWFSELGQHHDKDSSVALAIELYIFILNLTLTAQVIINGISHGFTS